MASRGAHSGETRMMWFTLRSKSMNCKLVLQHTGVNTKSHDLFSSKELQVWVRPHSVSNPATSGLREKF